MELAHTVTRKSLEDAWRLASTMRKSDPRLLGQARAAAHGKTCCARALILARARDSKLLLALEQSAVILRTMSEEQSNSVHGIDMGGFYVKHTEFQMFENAYKLADAGRQRLLDEHELEVYQWTYVMAGLLAGVIPGRP